jgi:hypothetical protein
VPLILLLGAAVIVREGRLMANAPACKAQRQCN